MSKKHIISLCGAAMCLLAVVLVLLLAQTHANSQVGIRFIGLTNNPIGLLGTSDKVLAMFSVTNRTGSPTRAIGIYYIESSGSRWTYCPLGSGSVSGSSAEIAPHGNGMIFTRIPTNRSAPWRVIVPYAQATFPGRVAIWIRDAEDKALKRTDFDFDRYGNNAPASDWIKQ